MNALTWWQPGVHEGRRPALLARNRVKSALTGYFTDRDFVEVDTACLQVSPGNETHLHAFSTTLTGTDLRDRRLYLHTSPEFACKKLLAAGEPRIFTFAHVFRNRERGPLHHPEFTMLEWYRAGVGIETLMADLENMLSIAATTCGSPLWRWGDRICDPAADAERIRVDDAFSRYAGIDLRATYDAASQDRAALAEIARARGFAVALDETWSDLFSRLLAALVEPHLGQQRPQFLTAYPVSEAALAEIDPADPATAQRFELYVCGIELANGFKELTDAREQQTRFEQQMNVKQHLYGERYPLDAEFLAALQIMPPASGVAMGFDRLVLLATGAQRIDQVVWTPVTDVDDGGRG